MATISPRTQRVPLRTGLPLRGALPLPRRLRDHALRNRRRGSVGVTVATASSVKMDAMAETPASASSSDAAQDTVRKLVAEHRRFLAFLERRLGDRALAEDVLHHAFVRTLERGGELRDSESAVAWFYRMLRNAVTDHHRRSGAARRALGAFERELAATAEGGGELRESVCECIGELAGTLKPEYAQALTRIEVDGLAVKEFANELGITANAAGVRVFRAREALRRRLKECCGSCAEHGCVECHCKV